MATYSMNGKTAIGQTGKIEGLTARQVVLEVIAFIEHLQETQDLWDELADVLDQCYLGNMRDELTNSGEWSWSMGGNSIEVLRVG